MKKLLTLFTATLLCTSITFAQEAFKHLGASLEFGTTGFGVNVSYPVVTRHLIVSMGYNFPSISVSSHFDMNGQPINSRIKSANSMIDTYNEVIQKYPAQAQQMGMTPMSKIEEVDKISTKANAKLNFGNIKLMAEYYPSKSNFFHITAGVLIGSGDWIDIDAQVDDKVWKTYTTAIEQNKKIPTLKKADYPILPRDINPVAGLENAAKLNIHDETYHLRPESGGHLNTKLTINKVKPYLGIGFGSSIPTERRLNFQTELGVYYQGKPSMESDAKVEHDPNAFSSKVVDEIIDNLIYLRWYPQITFRFTGRIF